MTACSDPKKTTKCVPIPERTIYFIFLFRFFALQRKNHSITSHGGEQGAGFHSESASIIFNMHLKLTVQSGAVKTFTFAERRRNRILRLYFGFYRFHGDTNSKRAKMIYRLQVLACVCAFAARAVLNGLTQSFNAWLQLKELIVWYARVKMKKSAV